MVPKMKENKFPSAVERTREGGGERVEKFFAARSKVRKVVPQGAATRKKRQGGMSNAGRS